MVWNRSRRLRAATIFGEAVSTATLMPKASADLQSRSAVSKRAMVRPGGIVVIIPTAAVYDTFAHLRAAILGAVYGAATPDRDRRFVQGDQRKPEILPSGSALPATTMPAKPAQDGQNGIMPRSRTLSVNQAMARRATAPEMPGMMRRG